MPNKKQNKKQAPPQKQAGESQVKKPIAEQTMFRLGKQNYYIMLLGLVLIVVGFILMSGGRWTNPNVFPESELYSTQRITIAPIIVIIGFIVEVYAVFHKHKKSA